MTDFYCDDPRRKEVWNSWKNTMGIPESYEENGYDDSLPYMIPEGEGWRLLNGGSGGATIGGCLGVVKGLIVAILLLLAILLLMGVAGALFG